MTVQRFDGDIIFECDECGKVLETGDADFADALSSMRDAGWQAEKVGYRWGHFCDACGHQDDADDFTDEP